MVHTSHKCNSIDLGISVITSSSSLTQRYVYSVMWKHYSLKYLALASSQKTSLTLLARAYLIVDNRSLIAIHGNVISMNISTMVHQEYTIKEKYVLCAYMYGCVCVCTTCNIIS